MGVQTVEDYVKFLINFLKDFFPSLTKMDVGHLNCSRSSLCFVAPKGAVFMGPSFKFTALRFQ